MPAKYIDEYRDRDISKAILQKIETLSRKEIRLMEVCGTHTMSIFKNGIRTMLPDTISLLSGPGCPVCVTTRQEIDMFIELSRREDVIVATFGDLIRVPGSESSLQKEKAGGSDIRIVYSTMDALQIAQKNPDKSVVFLGIGFETTAPTVAASLLSAKQMGMDNYFVFSAHKLVPPALTALVGNKDVRVDGFILPGHVSVIIGEKAYRSIVSNYHVPCVIAGFEPTDILQAIFLLITQIGSSNAKVENAYPRAVTVNGNETAQRILSQVFKVTDASWRGIGMIPESGMKIRKEFSAFDAEKRFHPKASESKEPPGCACGKILIGLMTPPDCPLYGNTCTPVSPIGPCMVSTEGTCAAYYRYYRNE